MADWLVPLVEAGADIPHRSQRRFWEPKVPEIDGEVELNFAGWAKKLTGAVTISVAFAGLSGDAIAAFGGESSKLVSLDPLIRRLEREEFDLIAVGWPQLADPFWAYTVHHRLAARFSIVINLKRLETRAACAAQVPCLYIALKLLLLCQGRVAGWPC